MFLRRSTQISENLTSSKEKKKKISGRPKTYKILILWKNTNFPIREKWQSGNSFLGLITFLNKFLDVLQIKLICNIKVSFPNLMQIL